MPWCPKCKYEYTSEVTYCTDCECSLVPDRPYSPIARTIVQKPQSPTFEGISAGARGAMISWMGFVVIAFTIIPLINIGTQGICLFPIISSLAGFRIGMRSKTTFMSTLIGWLIISAPLLAFAGLGCAHDKDPISIPLLNLIWCMMLSPLILGPLSTVAGALFTRSRRAGLTLCIVPTAALLIASNIIGSGK